jgi:hypothetical protein
MLVQVQSGVMPPMLLDRDGAQRVATVCLRASLRFQRDAGLRGNDRPPNRRSCVRRVHDAHTRPNNVPLSAGSVDWRGRLAA